jgi:ribosomal protein L12E/L44/L45/RPP1/RPP2
MARLGRLPKVGDSVDFAERRITVQELEGRRVGRVLVTAVRPPAEAPAGAPAQAQAEAGRGRTVGVAPGDPAVGAAAIDQTAADAREDVAGRG